MLPKSLDKNYLKYLNYDGPTFLFAWSSSFGHRLLKQFPMLLNMAVNILPIAPQMNLIHLQIGKHIYLLIQLHNFIIALPTFLHKPLMMLQRGAQIYLLIQVQHFEIHLPMGTNMLYQIHLKHRPMKLKHGY
jgi:hypothetical protein